MVTRPASGRRAREAGRHVRDLRIGPADGVSAALLAAVQTGKGPALTTLARVAVGRPEALIAVAVRHRVAGYLRLAVLRLSDDRPHGALAAAGLDRICREQFARHVRLTAELLHLGGALDRGGVPWAAIKGPVLAEVVHARPDLRSYVDLDLLVPPERLGDALELLETAGCTLVEGNWPLVRRIAPGQLHLVSPGGTLVDLHWHVVNDRDAREGGAMPTEALLSRTRMVALADGRVPALDPVDTVVHLCVHGAQSGGNRLAWLVDIDRALAKTSLDEVVARALELRVGPMVEVMLRRTRKVLGTPVPSSYLRQLAPEATWRVVSRVSAYLPQVHRAQGGGSVARLVARAARSDAPASLREAVRRAAGWLRHGTTAASAGGRDLWDEHDPQSMLFNAGDPNGLAAFLAAVVAESQSSAESRSRNSAAASSGSK